MGAHIEVQSRLTPRKDKLVQLKQNPVQLKVESKESREMEGNLNEVSEREDGQIGSIG